MKSRVPLLALAVIMLVPGCSPRIESASHRFETAIIDDVLTVTNSGGPRYTEPLFTYEEILRLKEDPENEESLLFRPRQFIRDEDGYYYVIDAGNMRIAVFDQNGDYISDIGKAGEGPGEFQAIHFVKVHGGAVQVFDYSNNRLTRFKTGGTLIDVITLNQAVSNLELDNPLSAFLTENDRLILISQQDVIDSEGVITWNKLVVLGPGLELEWETETPRHKTQTWGMIQGRPGLGVIIPYHSRGRIGFDPIHGILISPGDEPILLIYSPDGSLQKQIRIEIEERPITAEDRAAVMDSFDERIANASERSAEQLRSMKEATIFPERWPFWDAAGMDDRGYIWLAFSESTADREAAGGGYLRMLFSPEGEYLGNSRLPSGAMCYGQWLTRTTDQETGAVVFIVYEIRSAIEGFEYP